MNEALLHIEITTQERNILLRGLRYIRSGIMLETREPSPNDTFARSVQLDEIQMLSQRLESTDQLSVPV